MIVAVSGKARSGKNTFADFLAVEMYNRTRHVFTLMAYADELKNRLQKDFDLSWEQLWGSDKELEDKRYPKGLDGITLNSCWTAREMMQHYGNLMRWFHSNFWVEKLFDVIDAKYDDVIITDVRFPNEVDPVLERGGYHVRINRVNTEEVHGSLHASETSLDAPYKVDFVVTNSGTLEDLKKLAGDIASGIIQLEKLRR